jgi:hypothetical protein
VTWESDGVLYFLLRMVFLALASIPIVLHELFKLIFRIADQCRLLRWITERGKKPAHGACESVAVELWVVLWFLVNWLILLPGLAGGPAVWLLYVLGVVLVFRLSEILHFLFEHHIPRKKAQRSVGRSLMLLAFNYLEVAVIFAGFFVLNARLAGDEHSPGHIPEASEALTASLGVLVARFDFGSSWQTAVPNGVLSGIEFALGLFILLVVLVQILAFGEEGQSGS